MEIHNLRFNTKGRISRKQCQENDSIYTLKAPVSGSNTLRTVSVIDYPNKEEYTLLVRSKDKVTSDQLKIGLMRALGATHSLLQLIDKYNIISINDWVIVRPETDLVKVENIHLLSKKETANLVRYTKEAGYEVVSIRNEDNDEALKPTPAIFRCGLIQIPNDITSNAVFRRCGDTVYILQSNELRGTSQIDLYRKMLRHPLKVVAYLITGRSTDINTKFTVGVLPKPTEPSHYFFNPETKSVYYNPVKTTIKVVSCDNDNHPSVSLKEIGGEMIYSNRREDVLFKNGDLDVVTDYNRNYKNLYNFDTNCVANDSLAYLVSKGFVMFK